MKIQLLAGRDFRANDTSPGAAVVNETFAAQYFPGVSPIGKSYARGKNIFEVVGLVKDSPYRSLRESILPTAYIPFNAPVRDATFVVRTTTDNPKALASLLA